jgi:hypothetical protein
MPFIAGSVLLVKLGLWTFTQRHLEDCSSGARSTRLLAFPVPATEDLLIMDRFGPRVKSMVQGQVGTL